jgi:hypothetical protein
MLTIAINKFTQKNEPTIIKIIYKYFTNGLLFKIGPESL